MSLKKVLLPIPTFGFDPSEVAIPWKLLSEKNIEIVFITPNGTKASADERMLNGKGLGIFKSVLKARKDAVDAYFEMIKEPSFCNPLKYDEVNVEDFDGLLLPGGHDKTVKEYLESKILQQYVVDFFLAQKSIGAICHGVVLAARSIHLETGKSILYNYKTTALLKTQELLAYNLTRFNLKDYYLTYPGLTVEDEIKAALSTSSNFLKGPTPITRDSKNNLKPGFIVRDRNYVSARWPGDVYNFSLEFIKMLTV
ncbi:MAG: hypothetical protein GQ540_07590 [Lutibacter sp.]|uniref:type 1 glutamine amidotransferase domain-containing protein n=1 Tax=Lutibacter sp. TaxID=1925666 RepID=UPI0019FCC41D|nr:type 1 glutamine amidotransferase domain-containing protein [Lutibacter sp.]NOR28375.1 hypothetical protein [Lutibacter sp.]